MAAERWPFLKIEFGRMLYHKIFFFPYTLIIVLILEKCGKGTFDIHASRKHVLIPSLFAKNHGTELLGESFTFCCLIDRVFTLFS